MTPLGKHARAVIEFDHAEAVRDQIDARIDNIIKTRAADLLAPAFTSLAVAQRSLAWAQLELTRAVERIRPGAG